MVSAKFPQLAFWMSCELNEEIGELQTLQRTILRIITASLNLDWRLGLGAAQAKGTQDNEFVLLCLSFMRIMTFFSMMIIIVIITMNILTIHDTMHSKGADIANNNIEHHIIISMLHQI